MWLNQMLMLFKMIYNEMEISVSRDDLTMEADLDMCLCVLKGGSHIQGRLLIRSDSRAVVCKTARRSWW